MLASSLIHPATGQSRHTTIAWVDTGAENAPETSLRTFWEISAATLYFVKVSGFPSV
jgi:hypothetical protein